MRRIRSRVQLLIVGLHFIVIPDYLDNVKEPSFTPPQQSTWINIKPLQCHQMDSETLRHSTWSSAVLAIWIHHIPEEVLCLSPVSACLFRFSHKIVSMLDIFPGS